MRDTLVVTACLTAWMVRAYFWPFAPCRTCKGSKTNKGSTRKRFGKCKRCGGTGSRQVLGSKTVHKAVRAVVKYRKKREK